MARRCCGSPRFNSGYAAAGGLNPAACTLADKHS
ncbi:hypothetical protein CGLO_15056 [Colletotrichum gloeosporioides Cg-14]|uniref:Uncharacterized protein n=1 Tax=Colletotrichum gloeosporioides (strain Cg-14) TaxID=1237896 RepID=T0L2Y5_COLGC|nr:hypothetical protein CGLO_15056 [Colletotrichum gloeosporioides Cg-14]